MWLDNYKFCKQAVMLALATSGAKGVYAISQPSGFVRSMTGQTVNNISADKPQWTYGILAPIVAIEKNGGDILNMYGPLLPVFGIGNTPVTADDYALAEPIDASGITFTPINPYWDKNANALVIPITMTCTKEGGISITELGLKKYIHYDNYGAYHQVLMYREVLAEPFTLALNETGTLTITVPYN